MVCIITLFYYNSISKIMFSLSIIFIVYTIFLGLSFGIIYNYCTAKNFLRPVSFADFVVFVFNCKLTYQQIMDDYVSRKAKVRKFSTMKYLWNYFDLKILLVHTGHYIMTRISYKPNDKNSILYPINIIIFGSYSCT